MMVHKIVSWTVSRITWVYYLEYIWACPWSIISIALSGEDAPIMGSTIPCWDPGL